MRHRILALLCVLVLLLSGCAVAPGQASSGDPATFYYLPREAELLRTEEAVVSETRMVRVLSLWDLLALYLKGPEQEDLISPFPPGTSVVDIRYPDGVLTMQMSGEFFTLTGVELSLASCCLADTVFAYTGREAVVLLDETESIRLELQPGQFVLSNDLPVGTSGAYTVYFADSQRRYLVGETRSVILSRNESAASFMMRQLLEGPENRQLSPVIPEGTQVRAVRVEGGVCTLDLSREFYEGKPADLYGCYMTIYGIVNSLTGLEGIEAVRFLEEGAEVEQYGAFSLSSPVARYSQCIGPVRTASGEIDVDIYVCLENTNQPFAVPCRVKQTVTAPLAEAVVTTLLSFEPPAGCYEPIPYGTELLSISISGTTCYVDLSDRFYPQEDTEEAEKAAVSALVSTLTALTEIDAVVLTIGGDSSGLNYVDISGPLTGSVS